MSPLQIHVLLSVFATGSPSNILANYHSSAAREALRWCEHEGLIHQLENDSYKPTGKGNCLVEALTSLPMPVQEWRMPE